MFKDSNFVETNRGRMILILGLAIIGFSHSALEAQNTSLTGAVKSESGEPVAGALVKIRSADAHLTYMVASQAQGRYRTPNLPPGKYNVQGFGGDYQSEPAGPIEISSGQQRKLDVILSTPRKTSPPEKKMTAADYTQLMPEGEGKRLLLSRCVICHSPAKYVPKRWTRITWKNKLDEMSFYLKENRELQTQFNARAGVEGGPLSDHEKDVILDYLTNSFGPNTPSLLDSQLADKKIASTDYAKLMPEGDGKRLLLTRCIICHSASNFVTKRWTREQWENTVDTMRFMLREFQGKLNGGAGIQKELLSDQERDVIVDYAAKNFGPDTPPLFGMPSSYANEHLPRTLLKGAQTKYVTMELDLGSPIMVAGFVVDSQGIVWVSERFSSAFGRFDPKSLTYTRIATPKFSEGGFGTVAIDPGGRVWFTSNDGANSQWFQYDPKSKKIINTYSVPVPDIPGGDIIFNTLRFPPDGSIWATGTAKHRIVRLDPSTRKVTEYPVRIGQHPFGMAIGGDQMVWFAGDADNEVVRIDTTNGKMTEYKLPTPNSEPRRIAADGNGDLWVNTLSQGKLVKVDYRTGKMTEYSPPTLGPGQGIDVDTKRNVVWFAEWGAAKIGRFDPRTNTFVEFPVPSMDAAPWMLQVDPTNLNRVWWNSRSGRIGYVEAID